MSSQLKLSERWSSTEDFINNSRTIENFVRLKFILGLSIVSYSALSNAQNYGDEVIKCIAPKAKILNLSPSEAITKYQSVCEREVDAARAARSREEIIEQSSKEWRRCVFNKALDLDDGVTAAGDIGEVVSGECEKEYSALGDVSISKQNRHIFDDERHSQTKYLAIKSILLSRAHSSGRIK